MDTSGKYLLQKAELTLNDLSTDGGILLPEQADRFIRTMQEQPTLLNDARVITMNSPKMNIDKIQFGSRVLQPASQNRATNDAVNAGRKLKNTSKPVTSQVQLDTKEVIAQVNLGYEILEDNIERDNFRDTLLTLLAQRAAQDIEELIIQGDTGSADPFLALLNGVLAKATAHVVDAQGAPFDLDLLTDMELALPKKYRNVPGLRTYATSDAESRMRTTLASRNTGLGDAFVTGRAPLTLLGHPFEGIHKMPAGRAIFTDPRNIIVGMQRRLRLEVDRNIETRELIFVLTARLDVAIEETDMVVKVTNLPY